MKNFIIILSVFVATSYGFSKAPVAETSADIVLICQSNNAKVYHSRECGGLKNCTHKVIKVSKAEAVKMGRRACKRCY